jgi:hypothetical protein
MRFRVQGKSQFSKDRHQHLDMPKPNPAMPGSKTFPKKHIKTLLDET